MEKLLEKRIGLFITQTPKYVKCNWPLGKLTMYRDRLVISAVTQEFVLKYSDIDFIESHLLNIEIGHHSPDVPEEVSLHGLGLGKGIKRTIAENRIDIAVR